MNSFFRLVVVFGFVTLSDVSVTGVAFADVRQEQGIAVLQCIEGLHLRIGEATKPVADHYFVIDQALVGNPSYRSRYPRSLRRYIREVQHLHSGLFDATANVDEEILRCSALLQSFDSSIKLPSSSIASSSGDLNKNNSNDPNKKNSKTITPPLSVICTDSGLSDKEHKAMCGRICSDPGLTDEKRKVMCR